MTALNGLVWRPNWYVTRVHAVTANPSGARQARCGAWTEPDERLQSRWQQKRLAAAVPQCANCLRALAKADPAPLSPEMQSLVGESPQEEKP
jgi:hypothetical protein